MDGNSVITQVAQQTTTTTTTTTTLTATTLKIHQQQQQTQNEQDDSHDSSEIQPFRQASEPIKAKKSRKKGFFKSLFCCFSSSKHTDNNNTYTPTNSNNSTNNRTNENGTYIPASEKYLLGPVKHSDVNRKCLIIDLDETLVHSSFKPVPNADFVVPVEIEGVVHQVYVLKRPYVDEFLQKMGQLYECVLFTASLAKYADPVADLLDKWDTFRSRLFREACVYFRGNYVKDLSKLGRDLTQVIICDNSPASYIFHPDNAVPVTSWFDDPNDSELLDLIPYLEKLAVCDNVYSYLKQSSDDNGSIKRQLYLNANSYNYETDDCDESRQSITELNENSIIIQVEHPSQQQQQQIITKIGAN